jgi:hypothetical protein
MIEKEFVEYPEAFELKQLGFDEPCFDFYDNDKELFYNDGDNDKIHFGNGTDAPTYSQAFRWFREKYGHHFQPFVDDNQTFGYLITYFTDEGRIDKPIKRGFKTPEEAELVCLRQLIEILKEKNK